MAIDEEDLFGSYEQKRAFAATLNLMDDIFFSVVMEHKDAAEFLLTQLLGRPIRVIRNKTQYSIRNIESHSVVLDALIEDDEQNLYDVEVQLGKKDGFERKLRSYGAALDWSYLEKGTDYLKLHDTYLIFISDFDTFKAGRNHYEIKKYVDDTGISYNDGLHILYFNTEIKDGSGLSKLLQYLANSDVNSNSFGALSQRVNYHKITNEGVDTMSSVFEDLIRKREEKGRIEGKAEGRIETKVKTVRNMLKRNMPFETALELTELDRQTYDEYTANEQ